MKQPDLDKLFVLGRATIAAQIGVLRLILEHQFVEHAYIAPDEVTGRPGGWMAGRCEHPIIDKRLITPATR